MQTDGDKQVAVLCTHKAGTDATERSALMAEIDKLYTDKPCLGSRQMRRALIFRGFIVSRKKVQRCMRIMCICSILPKPGTSVRNKEHETYPYLLRDLEITHPEQVWATDITYLPIEGGFMYLTAVIDLYSRKIMSYELSNSLNSSFCVTAVRNALIHTHPEIMNTDQGCQYTGMEFTGLLKSSSVRISMDSRGRALDNIFIERFRRTLKYEFLYCNEFTSAGDLSKRLSEYIRYYNNERYHSSVGGHRPPSMRVLRQKKLPRNFGYLGELLVLDKGYVHYNSKYLAWHSATRIKASLDCFNVVEHRKLHG